MLFKNISPGDLRRLVDVVCTNQKSTRYSGIFAALKDEANIGVLSGRNNSHVELSIKDILKIRSLFMGEVGYDLMKGMPATRTDASELNIGTEKVSVRSPKETVVELRSFSGQLKINHQQYTIPLGASLSVSFLQIQSIEHESILIVENYEAFLYVDLALLTDDVKDALIVYRGDKEGGDVKKFLSSLCVAKKHVYGWFDSDPHGINLALSTPNIKGFYMPENDLFTYIKHGKQKPYRAQEKFLAAHKTSSIGYVKTAVSTFEAAGACLMQESVLKQKIPLNLVSI